ncbi:hypothetical protein O6H91_09G066700 [Diphasiastrum complanatum]|uniref:Uncharacterized protein n=1 Tax=Diphasiastrum complanatum TaxID=34168 RepID=A0ACC2CQG9_DIPCM|nr:hypothetical protein O6H91_09G066700 [Diphasiastrum complanatum]
MPFGGRKLLGCMGKFHNVIYPFSDGGTDVGYGSTSRRDGYRAHESGCSLPQDVPKGCLAVYVGRERHRFVVPTEHLHHHLFKSLLEKSAKEFGFEYSGGIIIPCEVQLFQRILWLIDHSHPAAQKLDLDHLLTSQSKSRTLESAL